jgi:DNA-binding PadR family transcriptional regulator
MRRDFGRHRHEHGLHGPFGAWHHRGRYGFFGEGGQHGRGPFGGRHGGWGGPGGPGWPGGRDRLERGMLRYVILDVLSDGPKHGYEIIKQLEERTAGRYSPSPGALYPTLQYLEDLGLVKSNQEEDRRVYQLTDAGRAELEEHKSHTESFWSRFHQGVPSGAVLHEVNFLRDAVGDLNRTVGGALRAAAMAGNTDTVRKIRQALERTQNEIREIVAQGVQGQPANGGDSSDEDNPSPSDQGTETTAL